MSMPGLSDRIREGSLLCPVGLRISNGTSHSASAPTPFQSSRPRIIARAIGSGTEHMVSTMCRRTSLLAVGPAPSSTHARLTSSPLKPAISLANAAKIRVASPVGWIGPGSSATIACGSFGFLAASSITIIPARLWPTTTGCAIPTSSQNQAASPASVGMSYPSSGALLRPQPRGSSTVTVYDDLKCSNCGA
jgi:hypothetical protein